MKAVRRILTVDEGVSFVPNHEWELYKDRVMNEPWIGAFHMTPLCFKTQAEWFEGNLWKYNKQSCLGIYVMSEHAAQTAREYLGVPVNVLKLATEDCDRRFLPQRPKRLLFSGHWMRVFDCFLETKTAVYKKTFLKHHEDFSHCGCFLCRNSPPGVEIIPHLRAEQYDSMLQESIVFLDFADSSCHNIVVECIIRNTPIMARRHPATIEYLGESYPFFFDTVKEIEQKIHDLDLVMAAHQYLKNMDKRDYTIANFVKSFAASEIYRRLPSPSHR